MQKQFGKSLNGVGFFTLDGVIAVPKGQAERYWRKVLRRWLRGVVLWSRLVRVDAAVAVSQMERANRADLLAPGAKGRQRFARRFSS